MLFDLISGRAGVGNVGGRLHFDHLSPLIKIWYVRCYNNGLNRSSPLLQCSGTGISLGYALELYGICYAGLRLSVLCLFSRFFRICLNSREQYINSLGHNLVVFCNQYSSRSMPVDVAITLLVNHVKSLRSLLRYLIFLYIRYNIRD